MATSNQSAKMSDQSSSLSQNSSSRSFNIPSSDSNEEFTIRVLTLNCWGLWLGARKRRQRMTGILRYLRETNCDIVFLQEVWVTSDFEFIRDGTKDLYLFAHLFRSGSVLGSSGIVILCRWFPKVIHFEPYSLNGSPFYPWHGDWFAGKGVAYSRVDFDGLSLHLFSTHTHAYYKDNESVHDQYSVHRVCQSYQLARFITFISDTACNRRSSGKDLLIVAGDMNSTSSELPYRILTTVAGLTDCFKRSRYSTTSNIIHRYKLLSHNRDTSGDNNSSDVSSSQSKAISFCRSKLGDNFLLDRLDDCRQKIAHVLFDSDTDDEDTTYCHPRNSFTPAGLDQKSTKAFPSNHSNAHLEASIGNGSLPKDGDSGSNSDSITKSDRVTPDSSSQSDRASMLGKHRWGTKRKSPMKRIDFILCRLLTRGHCIVDRIATEFKDQNLKCSLSDHEPVMVELKIMDVSHDLIDKNHITSNDQVNRQEEPQEVEHSRPLASVVESKVSDLDASQLEETTNQWVPEKAPINISYHESNINVMESTQDLLMQYYNYNCKYKTQLFYVVLFMFIITLPSTTYYALSNELIPMSTIVFMWVAASVIFTIGLLIGFLCYRFEQGAIEAILNDISCKISVAKVSQ